MSGNNNNLKIPGWARIVGGTLLGIVTILGTIWLVLNTFDAKIDTQAQYNEENYARKDNVQFRDNSIEKSMNRMENSFNLLREEMNQGFKELRTEIKDVRNEVNDIRGEMSSLREEIRNNKK
jgi:hypothetical protein